MLACILFVFAALIQWVESIKMRSSDANVALRRVGVTKREPKCNSRKWRIEWKSLKQINVGQICKPQRPGMLRFCSESSTTYPRCRRWPQRQLSSLQRSSGGDQHNVKTLTSEKVSSTYCRKINSHSLPFTELTSSSWCAFLPSSLYSMLYSGLST